MQHTSSQKDSSNEWTFVSSKKKAKKHTKEKHLAKAKRQLHLLLDDDDLNNQQRICDPTENDVEQLIENIEECMKTLELFHTNRYQNRNNDMSSNFVQELLNTIMEATDLNYLHSKCSFKEESCTKQKVREIICYGIGNFDKVSASTLQSTKFSSPMIQLSCALLLRKKLEIQSPILEIEESPSLAEEHQILIPMRYYEPLIKPIERKVLQHFQVELLDNEQGKRPICSSQNDNDQHHADPLGISLFFMPHCPMRLYSNLLWANWEPSKLSRIVIFGNSFKAYDERILSSDQRNDSSNAIFPILDYVQEYSIGDIGDNRKTMSHLDIVGSSLSLAFNDCVIISFDVAKDDICWPNRPTEYLVQHDCLESEIL